MAQDVETGVVYTAGGPQARGLAPALARAARAPFYARKLAAAGVRPGAAIDWERWRAIAPTAKDELRGLDDFAAELLICRPEAIAEYWRSGGVTGKPVFYPRTRTDVDDSLAAFARGLEVCGVRAGDVFMCSLPLGIHPAGQQMVRAAEHLGAATLWAGAGNQTPSAAQIELVHELGVSVWAGMASFALHLAHLAEAAGRPLADSAVTTLITTAEMLSPAKRALLERLWGARVRDVFGMSEVTLMGAECGLRPGLHMWNEHAFCEVLDETTLAPVPPGAPGLLCVTPLRGGEAIPFLRWLSGDVVRLEASCDCGHGAHPRLIHVGRTVAFFKVKGVNLNHAEIEAALYAVADLKDFRVTATADERLLVDVETVPGAERAVSGEVQAIFAGRFGIKAQLRALARGTIATSQEGQIKAQRFIDER